MEVAIAIGITGFALTAILGLLPVALTSASSAFEHSRVAVILRAVQGDFAFRAFQDVLNGSPTPTFYTYDGLPANESTENYFTVQYLTPVDILVPGEQPGSTRLVSIPAVISTDRTQMINKTFPIVVRGESQ